MAFFDSTLQLSNAQALTSTTAASTNIYDITGAGSGNAPNQVFGKATSFGADIATGRIIYAWFIVTTAFVLASSTPHLTFQVQAAPDNGSNSPGTYVTVASSAAFAAASLTLGATLVLPVAPQLIRSGEVLPRFYRFNYLIDTSTFSAGAVSAYIGMEPPTGFTSTLYPNNFASGL